MVLSDRDIAEARRAGRVVIEPFDAANLSTSSYDVSLGAHFYREQSSVMPCGVFCVYDSSHVARVWGEPCEAQPVSETLGVFAEHGFSPDDRVIVLAPGETVLAHTEEFIGGRECVTTMMKARSSLGRSFVLVCKCAGWGDVGYVNRWTMEITNCSRQWHVPLPVGERVAQIVFFRTGPILDLDYSADGSYQSSSDIDELVRGWKPSDMLPKMRRRA